jgi:hypothetical protein
VATIISGVDTASQPIDPKFTYSKKSIADHNPNKMSIPPPVTPSPLPEWITL